MSFFQDSFEDHVEYELNMDNEDACREGEGDGEVQELLLHHHLQQIVPLRGKCEGEVRARQNGEESLMQKQNEAKNWQMKHQYELKEKKKVEEKLDKEQREREKLEIKCHKMETHCQQLEKEKEEAHCELYQIKEKYVQKGWLSLFLICSELIIVFSFSNSGWTSIQTCWLSDRMLYKVYME